MSKKNKIKIPEEREWEQGAQDALERMKRANKRGTGCYLTPEMIRSLSLTFIGEIWEQDDPRKYGYVQ